MHGSIGITNRYGDKISSCVQFYNDLGRTEAARPHYRRNAYALQRSVSIMRPEFQFTARSSAPFNWTRSTNRIAHENSYMVGVSQLYPRRCVYILRTWAINKFIIVPAAVILTRYGW